MKYRSDLLFLQMSRFPTWDQSVSTPFEKKNLSIKETPWYRQSLYLYGSRGYGKSHILLALACLLVRYGHRVVYLPDCRAMLRAPVSYLRNALLFAFADLASSMYRARVHHCETFEALAKVCAQYHQAVGPLCFVVDQIDAFNSEPVDGTDKINFKYEVRTNLARVISWSHFEIASSMANDNSCRRMPDMVHENIALLGGLTTVYKSNSSIP